MPTPNEYPNSRQQKTHPNWFGGLICGLLVIAVLVVIAQGSGQFGTGRPHPGAIEAAPIRQPAADRRTCAQVIGSDLVSPSEGVWFEASCLPSRDPSLTPLVTDCN